MMTTTGEVRATAGPARPAELWEWLTEPGGPGGKPAEQPTRNLPAPQNQRKPRPEDQYKS